MTLSSERKEAIVQKLNQLCVEQEANFFMFHKVIWMKTLVAVDVFCVEKQILDLRTLLALPDECQITDITHRPQTS